MRERKVDCFRKLDAFVYAILASTCSPSSRRNVPRVKCGDASHFHLLARRSFSKSFASHSSGHQPRPLIRIKMLFKLVKNTPKANLSVREPKIRYVSTLPACTLRTYTAAALPTATAKQKNGHGARNIIQRYVTVLRAVCSIPEERA